MLMYLSLNTCPNIICGASVRAVHALSRKESHEDAITRICRYLQGTKDKGLRFKLDGELKLDCYVDADFAGLYNVEDSQDPVCVKSRISHCLTLGSCPLIWEMWRQMKRATPQKQQTTGISRLLFRNTTYESVDSAITSTS